MKLIFFQQFPKKALSLRTSGAPHSESETVITAGGSYTVVQRALVWQSPRCKNNLKIRGIATAVCALPRNDTG